MAKYNSYEIRIILCCRKRVIGKKFFFSRQAKKIFWCLNQVFIGWNNFLGKNKEFLVLCFVWNAMISTTCSLKWVNELQHEILSQLIIRSTLGITRVDKQTFCSGIFTRKWKLKFTKWSEIVSTYYLVIKITSFEIVQLWTGNWFDTYIVVGRVNIIFLE